MKKILVLLLVLAVAGGVFAQEGTWTLGGGVRVGTEANFSATPDVTIGSGNNTPVDSGDWNNRGNLNVNYKLGNLTTSIGFEISQKGTANEGKNNISLSANYDAGNYRAYASTDLNRMLIATGGAYNTIINELWGYYKLLNGMVHLEGAYRGRGQEWWESDNTYGDGYASLRGRGNDDGGVLANLDFGQLNVGIVVPAIFKIGTVPFATGDTSALRRSVVGFKFVMAPIEFAAQFKLINYGVYFGGKYTAGPVVIGLNFKGDMAAGGNLGVGASATYTADQFGAAVAFKYQLRAAKFMEVNPSFWYNVIPDYFRFKTELGFRFENGDIIWKLTPQIAWNFLGTGAGDYPGLNTGIGARFNLVSAGSDKTSELWVGFKWGF